MICNQPRFLHPIDNLKVLSNSVIGGASSGGSVGSIDARSNTVTVVPSGGGASGYCVQYVRTVCNKCHNFAPLGGPQIDGMIVCEACYEEHKVLDNTLPCPFKDPNRFKKKMKAKDNGPVWSYTTTQANT